MNVLIVEDDRLISLMLTKMVTKMGHEVADVHAMGEDALSTVNNKQVDLILMDIMLEGEIDGIETMHSIQENHSIPVIYITGNSDDSTRERAAKTNYLAYLVKPITFTQLESVIDAI
jgi:DNA-binding response OmpR family regulator